MSKSTRREALFTIAASAAIAQTKQLTPDEAKLVAALVDLIIPRTDTPGAVDAGVPQLIDSRLAANAGLAERFRQGLKSLDDEAARVAGTSFLKLSAASQIEFLTPVSQDPSTPSGAFFKLIKGLTVDCYYTSKVGLTQELGWHGNTFLSEFEGCTHPEHQA